MVLSLAEAEPPVVGASVPSGVVVEPVVWEAREPFQASF